MHSASHSNSGTSEVRCYGVKRRWEVSEVSWSNATQESPWQVAGCDGEDDRESQPSDSVVLTTDDTWYSWDVSDMARRWVSHPEDNHGVLLLAEGGSGSLWSLHSSNLAEQPPYWLHRLRPKLELAVQPPGIYPTPTNSPTVTITSTPTATPTITPTPTVPESGFFEPTVIGLGLGAILIFVALSLLVFI